MSRFFKLLRYLGPYKWNVVQNVLFNVLGAFFALFSFAMIIPFLQVLFENQPMVTEPMEFSFKTEYFFHTLNYLLSKVMLTYGKPMAMVMVSVMVVFFSLLKNGFLYLANYTLAPVRAYTVRDIRREIYHKIIRLPLSYYSEARKGDVMARISNDVQEIEASIMSSLQMVFRDPLTIIIYMSFLMATNWQLTLFVLLILPVSGLLIGRIARNLRKKSFRGQQRLGTVMSVIEETLTGLRIIKGFNGEDQMESRFGDANNRFARMMKRIMRRRQLAGPLSEFMGTIVLMLLMAYGGWLVLSGQNGMTSESLIFFLVVFSQVITPVKNFSNAWFSIQKGMASVDRVDELLDADERIVEVPNPIPVKDFTDAIEFKNVTFRYDEEDVVKDVNLKIRKGQLIALVGKSGAGKSTLVDLLPRFMDPVNGEVLLDGVSLKEYSLKDLRNLMGIVSQDSILFNDSFYNNISFGAVDPDPSSVDEAARVANAMEFIMETPDGMEESVGDGGNKLSGGQKQRISIARAVMANPPILILDEATSSLDTESERVVQDAIEHLMKNRTSIVIAHRLSTIKNADLIVVLDEGRIVEQGRHEELVMIEGGVYQRLHSMQSF
ncbi:MAG: ABC transporter transmembrane domain-containing protein [Bacteroidales bacterium]|nr:ABC transporter transmembrane domain-containing protein [Bacteroidales bacterium]MDT8431034.1 ABC transporter transmembrane domain-containing protein [Bacteroidales bacterium]